MVQINITYQNTLRCEATHEPSGTTLVTDAPKDNQGMAASFSPTDLVATALGTCILTTMEIVARRMDIALDGATATVVKEMAQQPSRKIGKLAVHITIPVKVSDEARQKLEHAAHACPVHKSLHPDVQMPITINWA
jgi:putative redox protein